MQIERISETVMNMISRCTADARLGKSKRIEVHAITVNFSFSRDRIDECKPLIRDILNLMPLQFHQHSGGGWSFLNLGDTASGEQWTGFHSVMECLVALAIAADMGNFCLERGYWDCYPGGMPYVYFNTNYMEGEVHGPVRYASHV